MKPPKFTWLLAPILIGFLIIQSCNNNKSGSVKPSPDRQIRTAIFAKGADTLAHPFEAYEIRKDSIYFPDSNSMKAAFKRVSKYWIQVGVDTTKVDSITHKPMPVFLPVPDSIILWVSGVDLDSLSKVKKHL